MTKDEVLKLALKAMKRIDEVTPTAMAKCVIPEIEQALAQPEQEPVAWMDEEMTCIFFDAERPEPFDFDFWKPLYATPPQRKPLTDEEIDEWTPEIHVVIKAIEAKLRSKNT